MRTLVVALRVALVTLIVTGILYPLAVTGLAQLLFPHRANGSLVTDLKGNVVGSELIGQAFADPAYLHPRPSANSYDASNSGGTNLATTSKKLRDDAQQLAATYRSENGLPAAAAIPVDAVTRSASGLDPHVSPDNARLQAARIAKTRGVAIERVHAIIEERVAGRELGFLGEPRVNVLEVNLALDRTFGAPAHLATDGKR
jgi:K+-transporting ATPase ATPase C chain